MPALVEIFGMTPAFNSVVERLAIHGERSWAAANRVALEACVQARNEVVI
jgi:ribulose 1,5-bisphosphate carboxylase large subunit-like protein